MRQTLTLACLALLTVGLIGAGAVQAQLNEQPASTDGPNLLVNPGFESPYNKQCCHTEPQYLPNTPIDEIQVAAGWRAWWLEPSYPNFPPTCGGCTSWHRPEWREAAPFANRIHSGNNSQKYFTFYSVHRAGMYQQVNGVTPGQHLRFSVYMQAWSTNTNDTTSTLKDNDMQMKVGIDPTGGTDAFSSNIVWSTPFNSFDVFSLYSIDAVAQKSTVTVFTYSNPRWGLQHNDIYIDDASLVVTDGSSSAPQPTATPVTPAPGATATPFPTQSFAPTATATVPPTQPPAFFSYTIQRGDSLYSIARKFGTSYQTLQNINGISNPSRIFTGQVIRIPNGSGVNTSQPGVVATQAPINNGQASTYTIQRGDRLVFIARRFNVTLNAIIAVNPGLNINRLFPGQVINIPASQARTSYIVQSGDTLAKIAIRFGTTIGAIQALNGISNTNTIFVGQLLLIP